MEATTLSSRRLQSSTSASPSNSSTPKCQMQVSEESGTAGIRMATNLVCFGTSWHTKKNCVSQFCSLCRVRASPMTEGFPNCSVFANVVPFTPRVTEVPRTTSSLPVSSTPSTSNANTCSVKTSSADMALGIMTVTDQTCVNGGLGCFDGVCRFCKTKDTPSSTHFLACTQVAQEDAAVPVTNCDSLVSFGDKQVGISAVDDATCVDGGLGCFSDTCRFCQVVPSPESAHLLPCKSFTLSLAQTPIDVQKETVHESLAFWLVGIAYAVVLGLLVMALVVRFRNQRPHPEPSIDIANETEADADAEAGATEVVVEADADTEGTADADADADTSVAASGYDSGELQQPTPGVDPVEVASL